MAIEDTEEDTTIEGRTLSNGQEDEAIDQLYRSLVSQLDTFLPDLTMDIEWLLRLISVDVKYLVFFGHA